jgi:oligosaccharide repeat unit polymerase
MFLFGWLASCYRNGKLIIRPRLDINIYENWVFSRKVSLRLEISSIVFLSGFLVSAVLARNLPILSLFGIGREIRYTDFGIPGITGLFNAVYLIVCNLTFLRLIFRPNRKRLVIFLILCSWPFLAVTRQLIISLAIQLFFIYTLVKRLRFTKYFRSWKLILGVSGIIYLFGYIGDLRFSRQGILSLISPTFEYPDYLPSGFIWIYAYLVSPINNLINNISLVTPTYFPMNIVASLIPSFARNYFYSIVDYVPSDWDLVLDVFNVSSMHQKFLMDFGIFISLILYFFISYFLASFLKTSGRNPRDGFILVIGLHGLALSFFDDLLLHLVFVSQMLIYLIFFKVDRVSLKHTP